MRSLFLAILPCFLIAACAIKTLSEQVNLSGEPKPVAIVESDGFVAEIYDGLKPNDFELRLSWQGAGGNKFALWRDEEGKGKPRSYLYHSRTTADYTDENIQPGATYRYHLTLSDNESETDSRNLQITIPSDFELKPDGRGIPNGQYHRVYFREGTRLDLTGDLLVSADEFIIEPKFEIHYHLLEGEKGLPKVYDFALIAKRAIGDKITLISEFEDRFPNMEPHILLESSEGNPFIPDERKKENSHLCVRTPELKLGSNISCNEIAWRLREKSMKTPDFGQIR